MTVGRSRRAAAIAAAGMVLSQPTSITTASRQWPETASSMESAMVSREASDARMPSLPIAMPSVTAMVLNSTGVPPPAITPLRTCCARSRSVRLHGDTSVHVCTTATSGLAIAASSSPVARSIARAGALAGPVFIASLFTNTRSLVENQGPKNEKPRAFSGAGLRFFRPGFWRYLRKPDSRACLDGNKDEYEYEGSDREAKQRDRHVEIGRAHV